jgi:hypothetical protein
MMTSPLVSVSVASVTSPTRSSQLCSGRPMIPGG